MCISKHPWKNCAENVSHNNILVGPIGEVILPIANNRYLFISYHCFPKGKNTRIRKPQIFHRGLAPFFHFLNTGCPLLRGRFEILDPDEQCGFIRTPISTTITWQHLTLLVRVQPHTMFELEKRCLSGCKFPLIPRASSPSVFSNQTNLARARSIEHESTRGILVELSQT